MKRIIFGLSLCLTMKAEAGYFQSPVNEAEITNIPVIAEDGSAKNLLELLPDKKPLIFVPAFFSCDSVCPLLAGNLRDAISNSKMENESDVVLLSFNTEDKPSNMQMFRKHQRLPSHWILAVSKDESQVRDLLRPFGYQFQKTQQGFDHPNLAFVLSGVTRLWTGMLVGTDNAPSDLKKAVIAANTADLNGPSRKITQYLAKPENLIILGFLGMIIPLLVIIFVLFRRSKRVIEV